VSAARAKGWFGLTRSYLNRVKWAEVAAVLLVGLNLMLLGLPGALFVELAAALFPHAGRKISPDSFWPMAIYVSALMPAGFLVAIMRAACVRPDASIGRLVLWGLVGTVIVGIASSLIALRLATS
jgi:hypothetical protein